MSDALVLLSGGMDSATALAQAMHENPNDNVSAISFKYGSRHQQAELAAACKVADHYDLLHHFIVVMPDIFHGSGSALMGESDVPNEEYHDPEKETPSVTVVPFRNANLISAAVAIAEAQHIGLVYIAVHATDAKGFAYPDCTPEFIGAMAAAVYVGTHRKVRLVSPFQWMSKSETVTRAHSLFVPLQLTWSCYRGGSKACGQCPTCIERIKAFIDAKLIDPIPYEIPVQYPLGCEPWMT
jgi:7-cyano-7-deazaguanine synthase